MRKSQYKAKIIKLLEENHLMSITNIQKKLLGDVDFSTVFRNLENLTTEKVVKKVVLAKDNVVYEINNEAHQHDHFFCNDCGKVETLEINREIKQLEKNTVSDILVKGTCEDCSR